VVVKRSFIFVLFFVCALIISTLACSRSGRILTTAEATEMAKPTAVPTAELVEGYQVGDIVYLTNKGFLVNMMDAPGSTHMTAVQNRGTQVEIINAANVDGTVWYFIKAPTGTGWVPEENVTTEAP